ncbi:hypothetical protein [Paraburkholderia sp. PGU19]|uniref:hypothetical protein n=1 Tax=Paraburkholderia sp. PGU19 TaxID=2735434 RepID=UPI0015DB1845|nr:hypothetical protein [Paraburkholderia sp. PGU19]
MLLIRALPATQTMRFEASGSTECGTQVERLVPAGFAASARRMTRVQARRSISTLLKRRFASYNWLRVSIRLDAARFDERMGWEEMAAAKRATRRYGAKISVWRRRTGSRRDAPTVEQRSRAGDQLWQ